MTTTTIVQRCADVIGGARCVLPALKNVEGDTHTCSGCGRVWRKTNRGHGPFWSWNGTEYARP